MSVRDHFDVRVGRKQGRQQFRCKHCNYAITVAPSFYECGGTSTALDANLFDHLREHVKGSFEQPWLEGV